jgi:hypothetical protein
VTPPKVTISGYSDRYAAEIHCRHFAWLAELWSEGLPREPSRAGAEAMLPGHYHDDSPAALKVRMRGARLLFSRRHTFFGNH